MPTEQRSVNRVFTESSIENIEQELEVMRNNFWRPKFSSKLEKEYRQHLNADHINTDKAIIFFGNIIFMSFIWVDFFIFPDMAKTLVWMRVLSSLLLLYLVYTVFYQKRFGLDKHALSVTSFIGITGAVIIFTASVLLPNPYNMMYLVGAIPLFSGIAASLRNSARHVVISGVIFTTLFTLTTAYNYFYGKPHPIDYVQEILLLAAPMLALFFMGTCAIAAYLTFSIERNFRRQWLLLLLRNLDAQRLANLSQRFRELSNIDELTGIANRRKMLAQITEQLNDKTIKQVSLIMLDVDYFKAYNDYYGHLQGDSCLKQLANCLQNSCANSKNTVARYGGEEFMLFLPNTDYRLALIQAQQIIDNISALEIPHVYGINKHVSASLGLTSTEVTSETSAEALIQQADEALYRAKDQGRNQVVSFKQT